MAVGALENDGSASNAGQVRVYRWTGAAWEQLGTDIDGEAASDYSAGEKALSLSADGQMLAIGAGLNNCSGADSGHVRIYHWSGTAWEQLGSDIDGKAAGDQFGNTVSMSSDGQTVAIGCRLKDDNGSDS